LTKVRAHLAEFFPHCSVQLFSSLKKQGVEEAEAVIAGWFAAQDDFSAEVDLGALGAEE
jgi:GTP-binding protein